MTLQVTVTDVNEATPVCSMNPVTAALNEGTTGNAVTFTCTDADTTKTFVYGVSLTSFPQ